MSNGTTYKAILLLLLLLKPSSNCDHDNMQRKAGKPDVSPCISKAKGFDIFEEYGAKWKRPFKVEFEVMNEKKLVYHKLYVKTVIMPKIKEYLSTLLRAKVPGEIGPFSKKTCKDFMVYPDKYLKQGVEADMMIFIELFTEKSSLSGSAVACSENEYTRPNICYIKINSTMFSVEPKNLEKNYYIVLHEIIHCLGFSHIQYDRFLNQPVIEYHDKKFTFFKKKNVVKFVFPEIVSLAQQHFGSDEIDGVWLESSGDGGTRGSHFEKIHFGNEIMNPKPTGSMVVSLFTLAVLQRTGWYDINMAKAERFVWGKGHGSAFFENETCSNLYPEYCPNVTVYNCSRDFQSKTYCMRSNTTDLCSLNENFSDLRCTSNDIPFFKTEKHEETGKYSRCFKTYSMSNIDTSACFRSKCVFDEDLIWIQVTINNQNYRCDGNKHFSTNGGITVFCPSIDEFCENYNACPEDCSGNGRCLLDGTCRCFSFYGGKDCSIKLSCTDKQKLICNAINPHKSLHSIDEFNGIPPSVLQWCYSCQQLNLTNLYCQNDDTYKLICSRAANGLSSLIRSFHRVGP